MEVGGEINKLNPPMIVVSRCVCVCVCERERERERERDAHLFSLFFDFYSLIIFHFIYLGEVEK